MQMHMVQYDNISHGTLKRVIWYFEPKGILTPDSIFQGFKIPYDTRKIFWHRHKHVTDLKKIMVAAHSVHLDN
jgi:hypothetical protein